MKLKPFYLGIVLVILLGLTASSALGVGGAGTVTGGTFPACLDPANANTSTVKIAGKVVAPGGLVRVPTGVSCLSSETTLNLNSYVKTVLISPGTDNVVNGNNLRTAVNNAPTGTLVKLEPGTYDLLATPLTMKQGIDLEGSGEGLTTVTSVINNFPPTSGTVVITSSSEVRFLTIANTGNSNATFAIAVYATGVNKTAKLTNVTINSSGSGNSSNYGIYNTGASSPNVFNSTISATGGSNNFGISNSASSSPTIQNSTITVSGTNNNNGIVNVNSSPNILNSSIAASGGNGNYGLNNSSAAPVIQNSTVSASGGTSSYGLLNNSASPLIQNSTITASGASFENFSIVNLSGIAKVGGSQLSAAVFGSGFTCAASYDANFVLLGTACT